MYNSQTFGKRVMEWTAKLTPNWKIPKDFEILFPFDETDTKEIMDLFYNRYYSDNSERILIFGINPGRFGAGITGIPFTDPIRLEKDCSIVNPWRKRPELSSEFVYEFIHGFGGPEKFYNHFYITSVCPLGFLLNGKNCNYYDDKKLQASVEKKILKHIEDQINLGGCTKVAICLGQGKNYSYFNKLNDQHSFFENILPLPHPRWVMQYRRKSKEGFVRSFVQTFRKSIELQGEEKKDIGSV